MSLFLLLANFLAALVAVQLIRGDMVSDQAMNFGAIFNAFIAMYQVGLMAVCSVMHFIVSLLGLIVRKLDGRLIRYDLRGTPPRTICFDGDFY